MAKGRPRLVNFDEANAVKDYVAGESSVVVAKRYNTNPSVLLSAVRKAGFQTRGIGTSVRVAMPCSIEELKQQYELYKSAVVVANIYGVKHHNVEKWLREAGVGFFKTKSDLKNPRFFEKIDNEEKAYWLGFFCSDGWVGSDGYQIGLSLKAIDRDHVLKFAKAIGYERRILNRKRVKNGTTFEETQLLFKSVEMWTDLNALGLTANKSKDLVPPKVDVELEKHFWRGVLDGDGSFGATMRYGHRRDNIQLVGTKAICEKFKEFAERTCGQIAEVRLSAENLYGVTTDGPVAIKLMNLMYNNCSVYLDRKRNSVKYAFYDANDAVLKTERDAVADFLNEYHYLKTLPIGVVSYGWWDKGVLKGVACIGAPSSPAVSKNLFDQEKQKFVFELRRFALIPGLEKNSASMFLARVLRKLKQDYPSWQVVVSFADSAQGHTGIIYQACGAKYFGSSASEIYVDVEGKGVVSGRALLSLSDEELLAATAHQSKGKHKYVFFLNPGLEAYCKIKSVPYPRSN